MRDEGKPLAWIRGELKSPPMSTSARQEAGFLLRRLQQGDNLGLPQSRPMPSVGKRCHELRVNDKNETYRIIYRVDSDAIVIAEVFSKRSRKTPNKTIAACRKRLAAYDDVTEGEI